MTEHTNSINKRRKTHTVIITVISFALFVLIILFTSKYKTKLSIPMIIILVILGLSFCLIGLWSAMKTGRTKSYFCCQVYSFHQNLFVWYSYF